MLKYYMWLYFAYRLKLYSWSLGIMTLDYWIIKIPYPETIITIETSNLTDLQQL